MISFGPWSTLLGIAAAFGFAVAGLLLLAGGQRVANRLLAALLAGAALKLMPYVLGFAGFYDAYPWLTFAPFDLSLGFGPVLYLYVLALTRRSLPARWPLHFAPLGIDLAYGLWAFSLPLARKWAWNDRVHAAWIAPLEAWGTLLSLAIYLALAFRSLGPRRAGVLERRRRRWLLTALAALGAWLIVATGFEAADVVFRLNYYQRFPEYLAFSAIILALGLEGWRSAEAVGSAPPPRDWREDGERWAQAIRVAGWWREPGLTLAEAARRLGTNDGYLSRALNEGLGINFATLLNTLRVEAVQERLRAPGSGDLLDIAFEAGFASKPSFNRAFREIAGMPPSEWRRRETGAGGATPRRRRPA